MVREAEAGNSPAGWPFKVTRTLPPEEFKIRPVLTRKGVTNVGLFSKAITRAEYLADQPRRDKLAERRMAIRAKKEAILNRENQKPRP